MSARMRLTRIMANFGPKKRKPVLEQAKLKTKWNIVRGDKVQVIDKNHREKGKQGIVVKVLRKLDRVIVEGVNMGVKHHKGDSERGIKGRTTLQERTLPYWAVNLVDPVNGLPTRVYRKVLEDGSKVRVSKKSGAIIPRPAILSMPRASGSSVVTESCTPEDDVWAVTYVPGPKNPAKYSGYTNKSSKLE